MCDFELRSFGIRLLAGVFQGEAIKYRQLLLTVKTLFLKLYPFNLKVNISFTIEQGGLIFRYELKGKVRTRPDIFTQNFRVVFGPCAQFYPCEASEQKWCQKPKYKPKKIEL